MKIEHEEYRSSELINIKEHVIFEAEEFKNLEIRTLNNENYQSTEIEERQNIGNNKVKDNYSKNKIDLLKQKIKIMTSTITTTSIAVTVVVGIVPIIPSTTINYGKVELVNYYIDYNYNSNDIENNVIILFENELEEGFKYVVKNKETMETKTPLYNYVSFTNIGDLDVIYELEIINENNKKVDSYDFIVNPMSSVNTDLSIRQPNYKIIENVDRTIDLNLYVENLNNFYLKAFIYDEDNNLLNYESSYSGNVITIQNIKEDVINVSVGAYKLEEGNFYRKKIYRLNNFNINKPSFVEISRVEILNDSFAKNDFIPTYVYLDGYLSGLDYAEVIAYSDTGEVLGSINNIIDFTQPIIFNGLPQDELVTFKYCIHNYDQVVEEHIYEVLLKTPEEYLSLDYSYSFANPGDGLITYNEDYTYNYYLYSNFENRSEYEIIYKVELSNDNNSLYEYIGTDSVSGIYDIQPNQYYVLIHKIFVKDGKNYYVINNHYAVSGTVELNYNENNQLESTGIIFEEVESKIYQLSSYVVMYGNTEVEFILSTNQVLKYTFTEEEIYLGQQIDLTEYEYDGLTINIKAKINTHFGMGEIILENKTDIKGYLYLDINIEYIE